MHECNYSYGTFLSSSSYYLGVLGLYESLRKVGSTYPLTVFTVNCSPDLISRLVRRGIKVIEIEQLNPPKVIAEKNKRAGFNRWNGSFSKLRVLDQTQFDKIVMLNADMMIRKNIDHLFDRPHMSAVAAGSYCHSNWTDFNSGLMVLEPSHELFCKAVDLIEDIAKNSLDNYSALGDQDIFHILYANWPNQEQLHLPESYNAFQDCLTVFDRDNYIPYESIHVVHFEHPTKPWNYGIADWLHVLFRAIRDRSPVEFNAVRSYLDLAK